jgi:hypothetical protein
LFVRQRIENISFDEDIPEELTADKYLMMYKKIWSTIRHDMYMEIQKKKKELRLNDLEEAQFNDVYNDIHKTFENVRQEVYFQIMGEEVEQEKAREYMQKAYVTYSTLSSANKIKDGETKRARWPDLVRNVAQEHGELV